MWNTLRKTRSLSILLVAATTMISILAQTSPLAFEVSVVKRSKSGNSGSSSSFRGGHFLGSNITLTNVLQYDAYNIPESRILGGPTWLNSESFDIEAKVDSATADRLNALPSDQSRQQLEAMFQQLLKDRFKLAAHWETRKLPVYAMVVAKKGPPLQPTKETNGSTGTSQSNGLLTVKGVTLTQLADALTQDLSSELGRVVIDKTGVQGRYDFVLSFTPEADKDLANNEAGPSIFTAIQEQLGLKLESTKSAVTVLVVDHAEMPSEN
jgi:uncharacterized protein (TIGR03435 family)